MNDQSAFYGSPVSSCIFLNQTETSMQFRKLGKTDLSVSAICLGTMTWGEQNTQDEAFEQIRMAKDAKVNFLDTAEMYPVPPRGETYTKTESTIGEYFKKYGDRNDWVLASKVAGPGRMDHIRDGNPRLDRKNITAALEASLKRLNTDYLSCTGRIARPTSSACWVTPTTRMIRLSKSKKPCRYWAIWSRRARFATSASPTKRHGALSVFCTLPKPSICHVLSRSRTPTTCLTAPSKWVWQKSLFANRSACWPIRH
ncbi:Aldo-keto reductase [Pseudomonas syringae pv. castaneae]|uniref:Aldo-keto reductase n=1 Tax=Pseudomonas syringae pv. castaneae TaxID=264450 RepID=A0A0P9NRE3_PSESX|nr:Aldo-keto reductase [Pseudomonas syringae pv. castaneae]